MTFPDIEQRPVKKRRFFVDDPPVEDQTLRSKPTLTDETSVLPDTSPRTRETSTEGIQLHSSQTELSAYEESHSRPDSSENVGFDKALFESFVGEAVPIEALQKLRKLAGDDMERAINLYFDGSWKNNIDKPSLNNTIRTTINPTKEEPPPDISRTISTEKSQKLPTARVTPLQIMPGNRYVGAFGVGAWATRSGVNLVRHGEAVSIERTKSKPLTKVGRGGKVVQLHASRQRADVIVRFTNTKGEEVGRLPKEIASWVSTLIDQNVCRFEGICVYTPDRVRINDTIYLQLRCSLLRKAFEAGSFIKSPDNNRSTGIFEEKETNEEKNLRLRQIALVKLFDEVNLHPATVNETTTKHKRQGLLQAAEVVESNNNEDDKKRPRTVDKSSSTPPTDEEAEDGEELEQDQLDTLYKKAQSFDFNTPTKEPADTFVMDLRKYQKQALYWMMAKEKDEKPGGKELSMHPLWEEYSWPTKDVDDKELPMVHNQDSFYVNPYSGELSLDFPFQEQNCLGGILADGKSDLSHQHIALLILALRNGSRKDN